MQSIQSVDLGCKYEGLVRESKQRQEEEKTTIGNLMILFSNALLSLIFQSATGGFVSLFILYLFCINTQDNDTEWPCDCLGPSNHRVPGAKAAILLQGLTLD